MMNVMRLFDHVSDGQLHLVQPVASPHTPGIEPVPFGEIHQYIGRLRNDRAVHAEIRRREGRHVRMPLHVVDQRLSTLFPRSEEHTSELQSLMRISYAVFCLKKKRVRMRPCLHTNS